MVEEETGTAEEEKPEAEEAPAEEKSAEAVTKSDFNESIKKLEDANKEKAKLLAREEKILAKKALDGMAEAGSQPVVKNPMTDIEYAESMERGEQGYILTDDQDGKVS